MVKRRKFIIGVGSLIAGGAAATGTGAFTTMDSGERTAEVQVAADSKAYVELKPDGKYARENEDGELELAFDDGPAIFEGGINPGSTYHFEDVFTVAADHEFGDTYFYIETKGFDVEVTLTADEDHGNANSFPNTPGQSVEDSSNPYKLVQPDSVGIDMKIEGTDSTNSSAGGQLIIHAASGGNQSQLGST